MVLLLLTFCLLLLPLWESVIVLCFVVRCFVSVLVLHSSWWGRESWLLCLICLPGVSRWLSGSSSRCHRVFCGLWLGYFLIILTIFVITRGVQYVMQSAFITPSTNVLGFYIIYQTNDQSLVFQMAHKPLILSIELNKLHSFKTTHSYTLLQYIFYSVLQRNILTKVGRFIVFSKTSYILTSMNHISVASRLYFLLSAKTLSTFDQ